MNIRNYAKNASQKLIKTKKKNNMKKINWTIKFGFFLIILSLILYTIHYLIFNNPDHIFLWSMTSLSFLPLSILFVTIIVNGLLIRRQKHLIHSKINMLIGTFFSEVGTNLLEYFSDNDPDIEKIRKKLKITGNWDETKFIEASKKLKKHDYSVEFKKVNLSFLRKYLIEKRDFLVRLMENPNLLERESFTDVLLAVFHLTEELEGRKKIKEITEVDNKHISGDIKRAYRLLVFEWLSYMKYLKEHYPYMFSHAMRTNPFDTDATIEIKE